MRGLSPWLSRSLFMKLDIVSSELSDKLKDRTYIQYCQNKY